MDKRVEQKLLTDKNRDRFGHIAYTDRQASTRSINTFIEPKSPRLANVLNIIAMLPARRHVIIVEDDGAATLLASILGQLRKVVCGFKRSAPYNPFSKSFESLFFEQAYKVFNEQAHDILIFSREILEHTQFSLIGDDIVLSATFDLEEVEAVNLVSRLSLPRLTPLRANEDVRLCLFLTEEASDAFYKEQRKKLDCTLGLE